MQQIEEKKHEKSTIIETLISAKEKHMVKESI